MERKQSLLRPVTHRPNLTVMTHAEVHRLEGNAGPEGFCIEGVWVGEKGGAPRLTSARREVILAAGSVASPQILQHSGSAQAIISAATTSLAMWTAKVSGMAFRIIFRSEPFIRSRIRSRSTSASTHYGARR